MRAEPVMLVAGVKGPGKAGSSWRLGLRGPEIHLVEVPLEEQSPKAVASAVAAALKEVGYQGQPLVLALPSHWCLAAAIETDDLPRKGRTQAMLYRLEEELPVAAEEFVADFVGPLRVANAAKALVPAAATGNGAVGEVLDQRNGEPAKRLGVAASTTPLREIVDELENRGVVIGPICPESLLALQGFAQNGTLPACPDLRVLWPIHGCCEAFTIRHGVLTSWHLVDTDRQAVERYFSLATVEEPGACSCLLLDAPDSVKAALPGADVESTQTPEHWAVQAAGEILGGTLAPLVDLRRGALASGERFRMVRRPLRALGISGFVLVICLIGALVIRAHRYQSLTAAMEDRQAATFRQLYPGMPVPAGIRDRLESEVVRLRATNGASNDLPRQGSALVTLYEVLRRLPTSVHYRLLDIRLGTSDFALEGLSKDHSDADVIAMALRRQDGFAVDPARTEQLSTGTISFSLSGTGPKDGLTAKEGQ